MNRETASPPGEPDGEWIGNREAAGLPPGSDLLTRATVPSMPAVGPPPPAETAVDGISATAVGPGIGRREFIEEPGDGQGPVGNE